MSSVVPRRRYLAPLALIAVLTYLLYDTTRSRPDTIEPETATDERLTDSEAAIPVSAILNLIETSVSASIDRYDPVEAREQMSFKLNRTYTADYERRLREIHNDFFSMDEAMLSTALSHLSRLPRLAEPMARNIFMTGVEKLDGIPEVCQSWTRLNPDWKARYYSDAQIDAWLEAAFPPTVDGQAGVVREMNALRGKHGIIRSDLFRYLALLLEGGVYSDTDTACVRPINDWVRDPDVRYAHPLEAHLSALLGKSDPEVDSSPSVADIDEPSLVVAVEVDAWGTDFPWRSHKYARGIQIVQWTIMGKKGHPVFLDALGYALGQAREIREAEERGEVYDEPGVLDWSGPGAFTDALMRYLLVQYGVHPTDLAGMSRPRRYGDVVILPMHAFRAEVPDTDKGDGRVVFHGFYGRWKGENDFARDIVE